jgi:ribosomal protein L22
MAGLVRCKRLNIPVGWKKLDFVLTMVRKRPVSEALAQLAVTPKKAAFHVERHMRLAKANAIQKGLSPGGARAYHQPMLL